MTSAIGAALQVPEMFTQFLSFVDVPSAYNVAPVCQIWNGFMQDPYLWKGLFIRDGIPMVYDEKGKRDYRADLRVLYPVTTVSGKAIRQTLGDPLGEVPCISLQIFDRLMQPDPFDQTKLQKETFELVVEYPFIKRILGTKECPLVLNADGNLVKISPSDGMEIESALTRIPFTLDNRIKLARYPLIGNEYPLVFSFADEITISQNDYCPVKVNVYFQTRNIVQRGQPYFIQQAVVRSKDLDVQPLGPRVLSDGVQIIKYRTCPDDTRSFARTSSLLYFQGNRLLAGIGGFKPKMGVGVSGGYDDGIHTGVVAGRLADVS